ncbi:MAG TPA: Gfo/Idh/MocA family oxidoreductase [Candidatus Brocadiia bacterium]|nr:Gfo/Idh/MocA family oxidoreductase [Candidatus Brocadiia bacterium]
MNANNGLTRRDFLKKSGAGAAAFAFPFIIPASALGAAGRPAPGNRITMGCIGVGSQGTGNMMSFLGFEDVQVLAVCDADAGSRDYGNSEYRGIAPAKVAVEEHYAEQKASGEYKGCQGTQDFREILARDDIDAVMIAAPDHWHAIMTIEAAKSSKDIFCQKPYSLTIAEGRASVEAVKRYGRVLQCGSQRRSSAKCRFSCELVRNGRIGKLHTVKVGLPPGYANRRDSEPTTAIPMPVPPSLDYDMWLGPAPLAPYNIHRCHFTFRWILDYAIGYVSDWGAHYCDMAHWGMGADLTGPVEIEGKGEFPTDGSLWNAAKTFNVNCTYADGVKMIIGSDLGFWGVRFEGTDGWVDLEGGTNPPSLASSVIGPDEIHLYPSGDHYRIFLDCVKTRGEPSAPPEVAHRSASACSLANIAMQLDRKVKWNPEKERFVGDPEADRLLSRAAREPWRI